jgi:siroheme synthase (precorrin-2 oxidase/ferrochelatase)
MLLWAFILTLATGDETLFARVEQLGCNQLRASFVNSADFPNSKTTLCFPVVVIDPAKDTKGGA